MATRIADVLTGAIAIGDPVHVQGWVRTVRGSKAGIAFVSVYDGTCFAALQAVVPAELTNFADVTALTAGCSVEISGTLIASKGKGQSVEIAATEVLIVGLVADPKTYPMAPRRHSMEHLRQHAHLRPRTNLIGAVTRVRHCLSQAVHRYFHENGFYWVHTPIVSVSDAEGAGEMFRVSTLDLANLPRTEKGDVDFNQDFFGREAFLTVSGQLNVETYCMALSKVYTFGPTFRAENSHTRRHLAEFWMIEPEIAFADLSQDADLAEDFLKYIFKAVLDERADDMQFFSKFVHKGAAGRLEALVNSSFERMTYTEAITTLAGTKTKFEYPVSWGMDLQSEHERFLTEHVGGPVVVTDYPKDIKAFYMRLNAPDSAGRGTVAAMDVLAPGIGEIIGGSQREERIDVLDARIAEMNLDPEHYWWYRELRTMGTVPHAGFGLGFERAVMYATGVENIRETIPFPRAARQAGF